jgi:hypothetical protein
MPCNMHVTGDIRVHELAFDAHGGYSLYLNDTGHLVHDMNIGGIHHVITSTAPVPPGQHVLGLRMSLGPWVRMMMPVMGMAVFPSTRTATLLVDGESVGELQTQRVGFNSQVSFSGLDIALDRGSPVGHYAAPYALTGAKLYRVEFTLDPMQKLDLNSIAVMEMGRQ